MNYVIATRNRHVPLTRLVLTLPLVPRSMDRAPKRAPGNPTPGREHGTAKEAPLF
jgi:hypothetical protein